jgi:hypothetical protein
MKTPKKSPLAEKPFNVFLFKFSASGRSGVTKYMLCADDKRCFVRVPVFLPGKLFFGKSAPTNCDVVNVSCAGAAVQCDEESPDAHGVLYIEHLGRMPVAARRRGSGISGFEFQCTDRRRWELGMAIAQYLTSGVTQLTRQRRRERIAVSDIRITRPNGEIAHCDALDISSSGMSLKTKLRLPIGERIDIGGMPGRVVRHHASGMAVELVPTGPGAVIPFPDPS